MNNSIDQRKVTEFLKAAMAAVSDCDCADFVCPACGNTAHAVKAQINGHVHAQCDGCGTYLAV